MKAGAKGSQYSREFDVSVAGNSIGYREVPGFNPKAPPDIVLVGDSYCFGWGVEAEETAGAQIAKKNGFNVYNLGIPGDGFYEQTQRLSELAPQNCNAIIQLFFDNDLSDEIRLNRLSSNSTSKSVNDVKSTAQTSSLSVRRTLLQSHVVRLSGRIVDACGLSNLAANMTGFKEQQSKAFGGVMQSHRKKFFTSKIWEQLKGKYTELFKDARKRANKVIVIRIVAPFVTKYHPREGDYDIELCDQYIS